VRAYDASPENRFRDGSVELNAVAYGLLREGNVTDAVRVFELNVQVHPGYANGWDSLGEAYVQAGRKEDAIRAFRRALSIQPGLAPSIQWLRRLGAEEGSVGS
jgi:Flp pilus assembly protein TadD